MSAKKIQTTKNYRLFSRIDGENRAIDVKKHKRLEESMKLYGFLECFPIVCYRDKSGKLIIKDGQHRFTIAEALGLPIHWIEEAIDFDVAIVSSAGKGWTLKDYALKHATNGLTNYRTGIEFSEQYRLPIGIAFALLAGTTSFGNIEGLFVDGAFKVKDRAWADAVAGLYVGLASLSPLVKNARLLESCMAVCRVPEFEAKRMLECAERCREKLVSYSTRDAYLQMMEHVYNFGRQKKAPLKFQAEDAMSKRSVAKKKGSEGKEAA